MRASTINRSFENLYQAVARLCEKAGMDVPEQPEPFKIGEIVYDDRIAQRIENAAALIENARKPLHRYSPPEWEADPPSPA